MHVVNYHPLVMQSNPSPQSFICGSETPEEAGRCRPPQDTATLLCLAGYIDGRLNVNICISVTPGSALHSPSRCKTETKVLKGPFIKAFRLTPALFLFLFFVLFFALVLQTPGKLRSHCHM